MHTQTSSARRPGAHRQLPLIVGSVLWSGALFIGWWKLAAYADTPGAPARAAVGRTQQASPDGRPVLYIALHPKCPCSRASVHELARLLAADTVPFRVIALMAIPTDAGAGWEKTDLWSALAQLPRVEIRPDIDGAEAARLGAQTSGQCFLFARDGRRVFAGGITPARGHEGDSVGRAALLQLLAPQPDRHSLRESVAERKPADREWVTPVFGCALIAPESVAPKSVTPKSVTPKSVAPTPVVPKSAVSISAP